MRAAVQRAGLLVAIGRTAFGVALLGAPDLASQWIGEDARRNGPRVIIRVFAARDAALGLGTLAAARDAQQLRRWLVASSACDAVDFLATLAGPKAPGRPAILGLAAVATVTGLGAAAAT